MRELEKSLQQQAPPSHIDNSLHELPPLVIDGIPTPVDKMTQVDISRIHLLHSQYYLNNLCVMVSTCAVFLYLLYGKMHLNPFILGTCFHPL